ncbi:RelA/SpoT domain-containing protein [Acinetobacter oleivorans]|uniref:RelA/SpoT domain-containing protein n=1 Tax=Acinetobacter oleivorans TaxID=1148157 RepID=UPI0011A3203E|nr:hypothetical protein [Acinetobacter oleivorans]
MDLTEQQVQFLKDSCVKIDDFKKANIDINLLMNIAEDYLKFSPDFLAEAEYIAKKLQRCKSVHSVRWRIKDVGHLIEKIVRKRCEAKVAKKYQTISIENYKSVITDLIGVRAIHLFKDEWRDVHQHILSNWKPNEKVVVYFRDGDNIDMFSGHSCNTIKHKAGYRSIHYIIPVNRIDNNKISCEIQTRTLFEEGWSEVDHRVRYPSFLDDENLKRYLDIFNRLAGSADEMGSYVHSLVTLIKSKKSLEEIHGDFIKKIQSLELKAKDSEIRIEKLLTTNAKLEDVKKEFEELKKINQEANEFRNKNEQINKWRFYTSSELLDNVKKENIHDKKNNTVVIKDKDFQNLWDSFFYNKDDKNT